MVKDAELHKEEDKKVKDLIDAKNQADALSHQTEKTLAEVGDKIDKSEKDKVQAALDALKETLKNENVTKEQQKR